MLGNWCRSKGVVLVIDGTQQFDFTGPKEQLKARLDNADYYIVSTHKWIGNIKTCGVVRLGAGNDGEAPRLLCPNGVSFGWNKNLWDSGTDTTNAFTWTGMSDVYVAYIVLETAMKYYNVYGEKQLAHATELLARAVSKILEVKSVFSENKQRVMTLFEVKNLAKNKKPLYGPDGQMIGKKPMTANEIQTFL